MFWHELPRICLVAGMAIILLGQPLALLAGSPDLSLPDLDGKPHALSEYIGKGKWTIVNVWGPRCPPCQEELPELVRFHDEHYKTDATVLGIALDYPSFGAADPDEVRTFADAYLVSFPILLGNDVMFDKFNAGPLLGMPTTLAYNPEGELVGVQVGAVTRKIIEDFIRKNSSGN